MRSSTCASHTCKQKRERLAPQQATRSLGVCSFLLFVYVTVYLSGLCVCVSLSGTTYTCTRWPYPYQAVVDAIFAVVQWRGACFGHGEGTGRHRRHREGQTGVLHATTVQIEAIGTQADDAHHPHCTGERRKAT